MIVEVTGKAPGDSIVKAITGSFKGCRLLADFDAPKPHEVEVLPEPDDRVSIEPIRAIVRQEASTSSAKLSLSYTINLNLPETTDVEVFNAIFSSLKRHLLTDE